MYKIYVVAERWENRNDAEMLDSESKFITELTSQDQVDKLVSNVNKKNCYTWELCPKCDTEVTLKAKFKVQRCPECGKKILPCSICDAVHDERKKTCGFNCHTCPLTKKKSQLEPVPVPALNLKFQRLNLVHFMVYYDQPNTCNAIIAIGHMDKHIIAIRPEYKQEQNNILTLVSHYSESVEFKVLYSDSFRIDTWDNLIANN